MRIEQGYVSPALSHLEDEFLERWNLKKYNNDNEPSVFFGLYCDWDEELKYSKNISRDVDVYNNHDGFKVLLCGGVEWKQNIFSMIDTKNINLVAVDEIEIGINKKYNLPHKYLKIPYFDFNEYPTTKLGDKIYSHIPFREMGGEWGKKFEEMFHYERLMNLFGEDRFCFPKEWVTPQECIKYFNQSFVNLKPHLIRGFNTSWKLGSMGRNTITTNITSAPNYLHYDSDDELKRLVEEESKKIGTIQENKLWDYFHQSDDWLYEGYWK
tara:strand:+ start:1830 stop:2633 length:804 start_codon:yes stop_codon:yes gene_type:complete